MTISYAYLRSLNTEISKRSWFVLIADWGRAPVCKHMDARWQQDGQILAGACIHSASRRQACIAMSSTAAEIIAASSCSLEIQYLRALLVELGLEQIAPTKLYVDNSGAVKLARDRKSCHRSRHIDRRYFKVRELEAVGSLRVEHVDTAPTRRIYSPSRSSWPSSSSTVGVF